MTTQTITRPILRYYGAKFRLYDWISQYFPSHTTYAEPFLGSAAILLQKPPVAVEAGNDLSGRVVNFFKVVREQPDALYRALRLTPYAHAEWVLSKEDAGDELERARRLFVYCWQSFSAGLGGKSGWRVTFGKRSSLKDFNDVPEQVMAVCQRLKNTYLHQEDYRKFIKRYDSPSTLFYIDPPYMSETRSSAKAYEHEFTESDHVELAELLRGLKGKVVLSGYPSTLYADLFSGWRMVSQQSQTLTGYSLTECLWLSPNIQNQKRMF